MPRPDHEDDVFFADDDALSDLPRRMRIEDVEEPTEPLRHEIPSGAAGNPVVIGDNGALKRARMEQRAAPAMQLVARNGKLAFVPAPARSHAPGSTADQPIDLDQGTRDEHDAFMDCSD